MSFRTQAIWHACPIARVRNNCSFSVLFDTPSEQTKATVTLFVLLLNYAHIRVIMTLLACRVMARMPVPSPLSPKSRGGSQIRRGFRFKRYEAHLGKRRHLPFQSVRVPNPTTVHILFLTFRF